MKTISVAEDFAHFPAGRYESDGPKSGAHLRKMLAFELQFYNINVLLDGTMGYGSSFLEEAFGGLAKESGFTSAQLHEKMKIEARDSSLLLEIWSYVDSG